MQYFNGQVRVPYANVNDACLDMTKNLTYSVVADILSEASRTFSDSFMHLGYYILQIVDFKGFYI
jgi:hypothetical protein